MASYPRADITPAVLTWAREQAKLSIEQAAKKVGVKADRFTEWEDPKAETKPTIKQLRKMAHVLHRPVSLFYLTKKPQGFQPMKDLRRLPGDGLLFFSPELAYEMELAQQRRELSLQLSASVSEEVPTFQIKAELGEDPEAVGKRIREALGITFTAQSNWKRQGDLEPFKAWRRAMEDMDVLVFQMSRVDWNEACGFALASDARPIVAVNRKDVPNRRTFSLLHEFVHLLLGQSGTSDLDVDAARPPENQNVEVFCNAAAASALMPKMLFVGTDTVQFHASGEKTWTEEELYDLAHTFGVSRHAILRRLLTFSYTTQNFYKTKTQQWNKAWLSEQKKKKKENKDSDKPFMTNPSRDVFYELGRPFVRLVLDSVNANLMTLHEASGHFGNLRVRHFPKLEQQIYTG